MAVQKLSVSFEAELAEAVREAAETAGGGLSGWLAEAAAARLRREALDEFFDRWERDHGPFTDEEIAAAEVKLGHRSPEQSGP